MKGWPKKEHLQKGERRKQRKDRAHNRRQTKRKRHSQRSLRRERDGRGMPVKMLTPDEFFDRIGVPVPDSVIRNLEAAVLCKCEKCGRELDSAGVCHWCGADRMMDRAPDRFLPGGAL